MVKVNQVSCVSLDDKISVLIKTTKIKKHSRIPVYKNTKNNIIGVILMKTLIGLDFS